MIYVVPGLLYVKTFISLQGLKSERRVRRLGELLRIGEVPREKKGTSVSSRSRAIPGEIIDKNKDHIDSFEVRETRYANKIINILKLD